MAFLDKTGLQNLTDKLVQVGEVEVASPRGRTVKQFVDNINRECDNVANPLEYSIENTGNTFKVGEGENIDVSGDAETGFTDITAIGRSIGGFDVETGQPGEIYSSCEAEGDRIVIKSIGKNSLNIDYLLDINNHTSLTNPYTRCVVSGFDPGKKYKFHRTWNNKSSGLNIVLSIAYNKADGQSSTMYPIHMDRLVMMTDQAELHPLSDGTFVFGVYSEPYSDKAKALEKIRENYTLMIIGIEDNSTDYEPYKEDKKEVQLPFEGGLKGWSNTQNTLKNQYDIVDLKRGVVEQKIQKYVFNGTENISIWYHTDNLLRFGVRDIPNLVDSTHVSLICDKFPSIGYNPNVFNSYANNNSIYFIFNNGTDGITLTEPTVQGFKNWIVENGLTVYYPVATPITHKLKPLKLQTYEKGRIIIENEVAPKTIHTVQLNRAGQIERGVREITELKERVNKLEVHYNSQLLEAQHSLEMLDLDYKLKQEVINGDIIR